MAKKTPSNMFTTKMKFSLLGFVLVSTVFKTCVLADHTKIVGSSARHAKVGKVRSEYNNQNFY